MTALAVRDDVEAAWPGKLPSIPLIPVANDASEKPTLPDSWAVLLYGPAVEQRASIGATPACWKETGTIEMRFNVKAGGGNRQALEMAEAARAAWLGYIGVNGYLRFVGLSPPLDLNDAASNGEWYTVQVSASYEYQVFK